MALSDEQIMRRVQGGELELFDQLVLRYRPALLKVARSKLTDAIAEDVVQEACLAAFAARHTYKPQFSFRTWLWTILLNLCRRQLKQRQRTGEQRAAFARQAAPREPAVRETGLSLLLQTERSEQLQQALARLPEVQADALRLRFFAELKFDEIAQAMSCSLGAAKARVRNGLLRLASNIREQQDGPRDGVR